MKFILIILLFSSLLLSTETITAVTETYPNGLPKEVSVYAAVKDLSENNPLTPLQKYSYDKDGNLTKYREYWENGKQSKELQINRGKIIERNWDIAGRLKKTKQYNREDYQIPKVIKNSNPNDQLISIISENINDISSKIKKISDNISRNYILINERSDGSEIYNRLDLRLIGISKHIQTIQGNIDHLKSTHDNQILSSNSTFDSLVFLIDILDEKNNELEANIVDVNEKLNNNNDNKIEYQNFKKNSNKKITDLKQDIRTLRNEIKQVKKIIDDNAN